MPSSWLTSSPPASDAAIPSGSGTMSRSLWGSCSTRTRTSRSWFPRGSSWCRVLSLDWYTLSVVFYARLFPWRCWEFGLKGIDTRLLLQSWIHVYCAMMFLRCLIAFHLIMDNINSASPVNMSTMLPSDGSVSLIAMSPGVVNYSNASAAQRRVEYTRHILALLSCSRVQTLTRPT